MTDSIQHPHEPESNLFRTLNQAVEPRSLRTYTPSQAVLASSAGIYHWTPEGRRLYDFTSGVLVANLGHNPIFWADRFAQYMGWSGLFPECSKPGRTNAQLSPPSNQVPEGYYPAVTMTAYNGITPIEIQASERLIREVQKYPGGSKLQQVMWAASGSEAIQKALWAAMGSDKTRPMILATRYGFHGKKGLAGAVTGSENDSERDPRVKFISFPMKECIDVTLRDQPFESAPYRAELDALWRQFGRRIGTLITEPYIGGGGSFHPPKEYLQLLNRFCEEKNIVFILDEVQSNFGRTGNMFAFQTYAIQPDIVVLGKGLGNGVPVAAAIGSKEIFDSLDYGEGSDTWSANPLCCAAVLATLDAFEQKDVLSFTKESSQIIEEGLIRLKEFPFVAHVRGENGGMVWGIEMKDYGNKTASEWANAVVLACYRGVNEEGIHLLGPLAKKVVRISPPLTITKEESQASIDLMYRIVKNLHKTPSNPSPPLLGVS